MFGGLSACGVVFHKLSPCHICASVEAVDFYASWVLQLLVVGCSCSSRRVPMQVVLLINVCHWECS